MLSFKKLLGFRFQFSFAVYELFLGIDVGTGSVRVGLFTGKGKLIAHKAQAIKVWKPEADYVEQSSEDIWQSLCTAVAIF